MGMGMGVGMGQLAGCLVSTVLPPTPPLTSACDAAPGLPWTCFPGAAGLDMGNFNLDMSALLREPPRSR